MSNTEQQAAGEGERIIVDLIAERDAAREEREVLAGDCERLREALRQVEKIDPYAERMEWSHYLRRVRYIALKALAAKGAEQGKGE